MRALRISHLRVSGSRDVTTSRWLERNEVPGFQQEPPVRKPSTGSPSLPAPAAKGTTPYAYPHVGRLQNDLIRTPSLTSAEDLPGAPNGGSARVIPDRRCHFQ